MRRLAERELHVGCVDLWSIPFSAVDPKALYIAQALKVELADRETPNELYVKAQTIMFGFYLLRNYARGLTARSPVVSA